MIKFGLVCETDHDFDAWFGSSEDFEKQTKRGLVTCPVCNSPKVQKSLMAPSVSTARKKEKMAVAQVSEVHKAALTEMRKIRDHIVDNSENVGDKFPDEARKIHYGEADERGIYGEASRDEVHSLLEEGIGIAPLPTVPEDAN